MKLDKIEQPMIFWFELEDGTTPPIDWQNGPVIPSNAVYQHSKFLEISYSIHNVGTRNRDAWPVRVLRWLIYKMPNGWKRDRGITMNGTLNSAYPIVKHMVEHNGWSMEEACVLYDEMCERCLNIALAEVGSHNVHSLTDNTWCRHCKVMDPRHNSKYKLRRLYAARDNPERLKEVYKEMFI